MQAGNTYTRWEKDYTLNPVPDMFLFDEYLEMVIQYGFVTIFVAAFPLAPLFALFNNIMEIRLDAYKFAVAYRRPKPERVRDLGVWTIILDFISKFAVLTNACVIAFTSDFVPRLLYVLTPHPGHNDTDGTLQGYVNWSLSFYQVSDWARSGRDVNAIIHNSENITLCRFRDFRNPPCLAQEGNLSFCKELERTDPNTYDYSYTFWHLLAAKLAFVLIFEHSVFIIKGAVSYFIPDQPHHITIQIQRENFLAKDARVRFELSVQSFFPLRLSLHLSRR